MRPGIALPLAAALLAATFLEPTMTAPSARVEHVVVLDITQSMSVPDMTLAGHGASRLAAAKAMLADAIGELPCGSKIGLGVFSEYRAFVMLAPVEVCGNLRELRATLAQIDGRMAWTGNSEVAKALNSSLRAALELPGKPTVVFITDGHEAPPISARYRPRFDEGFTRGEVGGVIVGVGGETPLPIPKTDPEGRPLGHWRADEVMQVDPRSLGRGGSVAGEQMVDDADATGPTVMPDATPGREHLSALREPYLRLLASETRLSYHRLRDSDALAAALMDRALQRERSAAVSLRPWLGLAALAALLTGVGLARALGRHLLSIAGALRRRA
jgi:mxaL protein